MKNIYEKTDKYRELNKGINKKLDFSKSLNKQSVLTLASLPVIALGSIQSANAQCQGAQANNFTVPQNDKVNGIKIDVDGDGNDDFLIFDGAGNNCGGGGRTLLASALNGGIIVTNGGSGTAVNYAGNATINGTGAGCNDPGGNFWLAFRSNNAMAGAFADSYPETGYIGIKQGGKHGFIQLTVHSGPTTAGIAAGDDHTLRPYIISINDAGLANSSATTVKAGDCSNLPVELTSFTALARQNSINLTWATASEENNAGFEVQRSTDGETYTTLAFVEGKGTTLEAQEYHYDDKELRTNQTYYYRLKQIDFDGQFEYSHIITASIEGTGAKVGEFYPNPTVVGGSTQLDYTATTDADLTIEIYNLTGQLLKSETRTVNTGVNNLTFDLADLPKGTVFVKLSENGADAVYKKLVIE